MHERACVDPRAGLWILVQPWSHLQALSHLPKACPCHPLVHQLCDVHTQSPPPPWSQPACCWPPLSPQLCPPTREQPGLTISGSSAGPCAGGTATSAAPPPPAGTGGAPRSPPPPPPRLTPRPPASPWSPLGLLGTGRSLSRTLRSRRAPTHRPHEARPEPPRPHAVPPSPAGSVLLLRPPAPASAPGLTNNLHGDLGVPRGQLIADVADVHATVLGGQRGEAQGVPIHMHPAGQRPVQPGGRGSRWVPAGQGGWGCHCLTSPDGPAPPSRLSSPEPRLFPRCPSLPQAGLGRGPLLPAAQPDPGTPHTRVPSHELPQASSHPALGTRHTGRGVCTAGHFILPGPRRAWKKGPGPPPRAAHCNQGRAPGTRLRTHYGLSCAGPTLPSPRPADPGKGQALHEGTGRGGGSYRSVGLTAVPIRYRFVLPILGSYINIYNVNI